MANITKYGLMPFIGGQNRILVRRFLCDGTNNSTSIFVGDVVKAHSNGGVIASTASATVANVGVVVGIYDTNQIPVAHPSAAVSSKYLPASTVGYVDVALGLPGSFFVAQSLATSYAVTDVFATVPLVATAGSTVTAHSGHNIGTATTGSGDFLLVGVVDNPANAVGSANCDMVVCFLTSIFGQGVGLGV